MAKKVKIGKAYGSVFEMLRETYPDNPEFAENAEREYERQKIGNLLFIIRSRMGLTQAEVAARMGITQSAVAKMEDRGDLLRFSDFASYVKALDHGIRLQVTGNSVTLAEQMRWHLESVAGIMSELEALSGDDSEIKAGVLGHFTKEVQKMLVDVLPKFSGILAEAVSKKAGDSFGDSDPVHVELQSPMLIA